MTVTLVLGGARSGKSARAQSCAETAAKPGDRLIMIATAQAFDPEMTDRIIRHRQDRDDRWTTLEAPLDLAGALAGLRDGDVAVVDCLTLWLSNVMLADLDVDAAGRALIDAVGQCPARLWLVSNEVGWGIVPDNALARAFRDHAGRLHQGLARIADRAELVVAGLVVPLKGA